MIRGTTDHLAILHRALDARGYRHARPDSAEHDLFVHGIRNASDAVGAFDDAFAYEVVQGGELRLYLARGTTDPGREGDARHDPRLHRGGVACLCPGEYLKCWILGDYKGHRALRQRAGGVFEVWRDRTPDGKLLRDGPTYRDVSGLHHHRAWRDAPRTVGDTSWACQVPYRLADHDEAMQLAANQAAARLGNTYSYRLLDAGDAPELVELLRAVGAAT